MSRHVKFIDDNKSVAYGHDHATGYFFQVYDEEENHAEDQLILDECSMFSGMSNAKMIELMKEYNVPQTHIDKVVLDLPF
jgi:hypothetical protein